MAVAGVPCRPCWRTWCRHESLCALPQPRLQPHPPPHRLPPPPTTDDVTSFLTVAVADLTRAPPSSSTVALAVSGVDSLAAVELRRRVAARYGVDTPLAADGAATVASIAADVAVKAKGGGGGSAPAPSLSPSARWIVPTPAAPVLRLFCLPYAGGLSEAVYGKWGRLLPPAVRVCPVELPGRGRRVGDDPPATLAALAAEIAAGLDLESGPYALFGTCLGAILAYEVAAAAVAAGRPTPAGLFVAAASPPRLYAEAVAPCRPGRLRPPPSPPWWPTRLLDCPPGATCPRSRCWRSSKPPTLRGSTT